MGSCASGSQRDTAAVQQAVTRKNFTDRPKQLGQSKMRGKVESSSSRWSQWFTVVRKCDGKCFCVVGEKPCSVAGCTTTSQRKGLCGKHGGGVGECVFGGCTNVMASTKWKTCSTHGGKGYCAYVPEGRGYVFERKCWTPALKWRGNCQKHTGM